MTIHLQPYRDTQAYQRAVLPFLRRHAAELNQLLLATEGLQQKDADRHAYWMGCLFDGPEVIAVALCATPPPIRELALSAWPAAAIPQLVAALRSTPLTSLLGPAPSATACAIALGLPRVRAHFRNYALVQPPTAIAARGHDAPATIGHLSQCLAWTAAFDKECGLPPRPAAALAAALERTLAPDSHRRVHLWHVDGVPVAMAKLMRTPSMARIGEVYTAPDWRRHGYGGALVAALAREAFARGAAQVCLFADAANPTSNVLYQRIGFAECGCFTHHDHGDVPPVSPSPA